MGLDDGVTMKEKGCGNTRNWIYWNMEQKYKVDLWRDGHHFVSRSCNMTESTEERYPVKNRNEREESGRGWWVIIGTRPKGGGWWADGACWGRGKFKTGLR